MAEKGRQLTGARARFSINGVKVGYATNVSFSEEVEFQPVEVLDNIEVEEHVPIAYRVTLTASEMRIVGKTIKSDGYFPQSGSSTEEHLQNVLIMKDLTCTIEDSKIGASGKPTTIMVMEQVKIQSQNVTVNARGVVGSDVSFVGVRIRDESEV